MMRGMKRSRISTGLRVIAGATAFCFLQACSSTTIIQSQPSGAKLYLNGEPAGTTPYTLTDTKIVGSTTNVRLEMPGFESTTGVFARNEEFEVGACIGGVFLLFPFLWIMKYKPTHTFELKPLASAGVSEGAGAPAPGWTTPPPGYGAPPPATAPPAAKTPAPPAKAH